MSHPCQRPCERQYQRPHGHSLVEACVAVALMGVVIALAVPSFVKALERRHLEGVAAQLHNDLALIRSMAVSRNETLRFAFAGASCYVIHNGKAGICTCSSNVSASCTGNPEILRIVKLASDIPVRLESNVNSFAVDPLRGTVSPTGTFKVVARGGSSIYKIINIMGRVRSCSPTPAVPGYRVCTS
jgi:type IV fimbrial biogenesis protein FimT